MIGELTNHLWQSTIFAVAAGLLTLAFRKNRAQIRYWLWLSTSLKFLVPFSLLVTFGSHLAWAPAAKNIATQAVSITMVQITQPFPDTLSFTPSPSTPGTTDWFPIAILGLWVCGLVVIAFIRFKGWLRIRAAVRASTPLEIPAAVEVRSSPGLLEPGVVGLFRPILMLPAGILERLTKPQLEAVLAHELCHVRRHDNLTAAIHMIVEAVFWFHPLVWWIGARLVEERERACDEDVLRLGSDPQVYAEGILKVCEFYVESPLTCISGVTGSDIKKRMERIMRNYIGEPLKTWKKLFLATTGVTALAVPLVFGQLSAVQRQIEPQAENAALIGPVYEDVSIKRSTPGDTTRYNPPYFTATTLQTIIQITFGKTFDYEISGIPDWAKSEKYDIEAYANRAVDDDVEKLRRDQKGRVRQRMLQALLEDRFQLKFHRETKDLPIYALVVAKNGPKLQEAKPGDIYPNGIKYPDGVPLGPDIYLTWEKGLQLTGQGASMEMLARRLTVTWCKVLGRPVVDKTGLKSIYDFQVQWAPSQAQPLTPDSLLPSPFTPFQEQLGLKLESEKGPVEIIVIDHVEKPAVNEANLTGQVNATKNHAESQGLNATPSQAEQQAETKVQIVPKYQVVSIKPNKSGSNRVGGNYPYDFSRFTGTNVPLQLLIQSALGIPLEDNRISGAPDWIKSERYDIEAKTNSSVADGLRKLSSEQGMLVKRRMIQELLEDRFNLKFHRETKELPIYWLVVAKAGKLPEDDHDCGIPSALPLPMTEGGKEPNPVCGFFSGHVDSLGIHVVGRKVSINQLVAILPGSTERTVLDKTGLSGKYDVDLHWTPSESAIVKAKKVGGIPPAMDVPSLRDSSGQSIFTAIQEQLGLKLESGKGPVEVIVIDHVERPSPN